MNEYRIAFTHLARKDIIAIGDYIAFTLSEPTTSGKFIKGLKHSISQLKIFPYKYPLIQDTVLQSQGIRCMPHKNYYIFYKVIETTKSVMILRIGYHRRDWKNILTTPVG